MSFESVDLETLLPGGTIRAVNSGLSYGNEVKPFELGINESAKLNIGTTRKKKLEVES